MKKILVGWVCAMLMAVGLAGVAHSASIDYDAPMADDIILRIGVQEDITTLNPFRVQETSLWKPLEWIYDEAMAYEYGTPISYIATHSLNCTTDTLFAYDNATDWEAPAVAGQMTVYYNFTGVTFHDGHQMNVDDIIFSYGVRGMIPDLAHSVMCLMDQGGWPVSNYSTDHWLGISKHWESPDQLQAAIRFYLQVPYADFICNTLAVTVFPQHIWGTTVSGQDVDGADPFLPAGDPNVWSPTKAKSYPNNPPMGSGPLKFDYWDIGQTLRLMTWRDHFHSPQPTIDGILYRIYKTAEQSTLALKNNDIDYILQSIPPSFLSELQAEPNIGVMQSLDKGFTYVGFNMGRMSFGYVNNDPLQGDYGLPLRRAIAHCVNKTAIVDNLLSGHGVEGDGPISSWDWYLHNDTLPEYAFDLDLANNTLDAAGWVDSNADGWRERPGGAPIGSSTGGKIEILTPPASFDPVMAQVGLVIASNLQKVGINAESVVWNFQTIANMAEEGTFDMYILRWPVRNEPNDFLHAYFHSCNAVNGRPNYPKYRNESYDAIIDQSRTEEDVDARREYILDAQASVAYDQPYNVLYFKHNIEAYRSDRFSGWSVDDYGTMHNWESMLGLKLLDMPPTVLSTQPAQSATNVSAAGDVSVVFSEGMNTSVEPILEQTTGTPVAYAFAGWSLTNVANDTATWTHANWEYNETITLQVSGFEDTGGNNNSAHAWSFTTALTGEYNYNSPFRINSNADFPTYANGGGDGTAGKPWIIENYDINGTGYGYCIYIGNTTDYFVVRNCHLHNASENSGYMDSGLVLYNVHSGLITHNTIDFNTNAAVILILSGNITVTNNNVSSNGLGIQLESSDSSTIKYNMATGNIYGIQLRNSTSNTIANNHVSLNNMDGIYLQDHSDENTITNNTVTSNGEYGIYLRGSHSNTLANNIASSNFDGIHLYSVNNSIIANNHISSNNNHGAYIWLSDNNTIINNTIDANNDVGLYLSGSDSNRIVNNTMDTNRGRGALLADSRLNNIYNNNFIDNAVQAQEYGYKNLWNETYPIGGNYWSDYSGTDTMSGPYQNIQGSDGIGDTPYTNIQGGAQDHYPLMHQFNGTSLDVLDIAPPVSYVNPIYPYWQNSSPLATTATAADAYSTVANVTLWYRFSANNITWNPWVNFDIDVAEPWSWTFNFPDGQGYYDFYSIANDTANNTEAAPATADASCAYDITPPAITDVSLATGTTGDSYTFRTMATDNMNLSAIHVIHRFGSGAEINATMARTTADYYELGITIPLNSLDTMHYRIATVDKAGNWNSTGVKDVIISDNDEPVADAGPDQTVNAGTLVTFAGASSTDNIGITNYTWTFTHNGTAITLYGVSPTFRFWTPGNYTVTLTVRDSASNTDTDTVLVTVNPVSGPGDDDGGSLGDYWWIILILAIVLAVVTLLGLKMLKRKNPGAPKTEEDATEKSIEENVMTEQSTEPLKNE